MNVGQYIIIIVNLGPTFGSKINKTRLYVVISPKERNHNLKTVVITPITATKKDYPTRIKVANNNVNGRIALDQIRTIDRQRNLKIIGMLASIEVVKVKKIMDETYVR
ncbi:MAG: type II toxin-antitoxin system PemK/MazF family toxin [Saprospiraceae bacterium]